MPRLPSLSAAPRVCTRRAHYFVLLFASTDPSMHRVSLTVKCCLILGMHYVSNISIQWKIKKTFRAHYRHGFPSHVSSSSSGKAVRRHEAWV